ncbi:hypothetical protein [Sphingopyxis witflariensis]|uniref:hypothetical protein n=1 Tax=Sphingopyxis witflariensis TaxID=173675 RepID=UPI00191C86BD|nr:hypothetical protein [Sphingopyxis witflariensis]
MAKIVFGMNQSLDGYVDHDKFAPDPALFGYWTERPVGRKFGPVGDPFEHFAQECGRAESVG